MRVRAGVAAVAAGVFAAAACTSSPASKPDPGLLAPLAAADGSLRPSPVQASDWPTYHRDAARSGLATGVPTVHSLDRAWAAPLDGAVFGQPIVVGGKVIAATENDTVYELSRDDGHPLWSKHLAEPEPGAALPCGNIDPLGITGTPAYDPATGLVFVVAEINGGKHILFGLDAATGKIQVRREVEPPRGTLIAHQERGALAVVGDRVYIPYGGLYGDCSNYVGSVLSVPTSGNGPTVSYAIPTSREGGMWATGGPVVSGHELFLSVGNGESSSAYDGSDSVIALSADLRRVDLFAPATWAKENASDLDLGSMTPALVGSYVLIAGKSGTAYTLAANHLGGIGGQVAQAQVCPGYGTAAVDGVTAYVPCETGIAQVTIAADGTIEPGWHNQLHGGGSPVIGGGAVWVVDYPSGNLQALDPASGAITAHYDLGTVPHFASPTLSGDHAYVGTLAGVSALKIS